MVAGRERCGQEQWQWQALEARKQVGSRVGKSGCRQGGGGHGGPGGRWEWWWLFGCPLFAWVAHPPGYSLGMSSQHQSFSSAVEAGLSAVPWLRRRRLALTR